MASFDNYRLVIPPEHTQCSFRHTNSQVPDELVCTIGVRHLGFATIGQPSRDAIRDAWINNLVDNFAPETIFTRVDFADAGGVYASSLANVAGTTVASMAALNNAVIARKVTGESGRRNQGRMYLPAVGEAVVDQGGNLTAPFIAGIQASMSQFYIDLVATPDTTIPFILHSKGWDGPPSPAPPDPGNAPPPTLILDFQVQPKIGTMRRRLR